MSHHTHALCLTGDSSDAARRIKELEKSLLKQDKVRPEEGGQHGGEGSSSILKGLFGSFMRK